MCLYLTKDGIEPQEVHANTIVKLAVPQDVKTLKSVLPLCNYCAEFISNFESTVETITKLLLKTQPCVWTRHQQELFTRLKSLMTEPPVLASQDYSKSFVLYTDASDVGTGVVLLEKQEDNFRIIQYLSRTLTPAEKTILAQRRSVLQLYTR